MSHVIEKSLSRGKQVMLKQTEINRQELCVPPCASVSCGHCVLLGWVYTAGLRKGRVCVEVRSSMLNSPSGQFSS